MDKRKLEDIVSGMKEAESRLALFLIVSGVDPDYAIFRAAGKEIEPISLEEMMKRLEAPVGSKRSQEERRNL